MFAQLVLGGAVQQVAVRRDDVARVGGGQLFVRAGADHHQGEPGRIAGLAQARAGEGVVRQTADPADPQRPAADSDDAADP
ncbi:hypothetical protein SDC9_120570 [bioreactor metagenome]|uniref:Uncharacterized protein n=1 Tax=bioreactor metagenome TaxID=1076179 RepID=A0A645C7Z3_9ZZZZ